MKSLEEQIAGEHYKNQKIQPIEYILANKLPFVEGNIVKYITRWREKSVDYNSLYLHPLPNGFHRTLFPI